MDTSRQIADLLQDKAGVREVLATELRQEVDSSLLIHNLTRDYFRQSPSRIVAQYTLDLESGEGVRDAQVITVAHFTDGRAERQWKRLRQDAPDADAPVGKFRLPGARYSERLQSIIQAFPFDVRVPGLRRTVAGDPGIRSLLTATAGEEIVAWNAEVVRYRPDMRAMARVDYTVRKDGRDEARRVFAKAYREVEEGQRAFDLLAALSREAERSGAFKVPQPLAYEPTFRTLMIAEASGDRLLDIIRRNRDERAPEAMRRAARAVAAMHGADISSALLPDSGPDRDAQFGEVVATVAREFPTLGAEVHAAAELIQANFQHAPLRPTHFDLKQGHILIDPEAVTILDFDKMAMGDPLIDVANVVATLGAEREGSARRAARRENMTEIFVDEYFRHVPADWAALFPAHLARATLLEAATTGRGQRGRQGTTHREERIVAALRRVSELLPA